MVTCFISNNVGVVLEDYGTTYISGVLYKFPKEWTQKYRSLIYIAPGTIIVNNPFLGLAEMGATVKILPGIRNGVYTEGAVLPPESVKDTCAYAYDVAVKGASNYWGLEWIMSRQGTYISTIKKTPKKDFLLKTISVGACWADSVYSVWDNMFQMNMGTNVESWDRENCVIFPIIDGIPVCAKNGVITTYKGVKLSKRTDLGRYLYGVIGDLPIWGVVAGPGIYGNKLGLSEYKFYVYGIKKTGYRELELPKLINTCSGIDRLKIAPILFNRIDGSIGPIPAVDVMNSNTYPNGSPMKGILIKDIVGCRSQYILNMQYIENEVFSDE